MQSLYIIAFADQGFGDLLGIGLGSGKDNTIYTRIEINDAFQGLVAVDARGNIVLVVDVDIGGIHLANGHFYRCIHEALANLAYLIGHGCAEKPGAVPVGGITQNKFNVLPKAHVEHFIGLVQHDIMDVAQVNGFPFNEVNQPAGSGHHNLNALFQLSDLGDDGSSTVDCHHPQALFELGETGHVFGDLNTELTGGTNDQGSG